MLPRSAKSAAHQTTGAVRCSLTDGSSQGRNGNKLRLHLDSMKANERTAVWGLLGSNSNEAKKIQKYEHVAKRKGDRDRNGGMHNSHGPVPESRVKRMIARR